MRADQVEGLTKTAEVQRQQQQRRKAATDAVVPQFAAIRAEAHLRHTRLRRLRQAVHAAQRELERPEPPAWPIAFSYDEGATPERRPGPGTTPLPPVGPAELRPGARPSLRTEYGVRRPHPPSSPVR